MRDIEHQIDIDRLSIDDVLAVMEFATTEGISQSDQMRQALPYVKKCLPEETAATLSGVEAVRAFKAFSQALFAAMGTGDGNAEGN